MAAWPVVELTKDNKRIELSVDYRPGINVICKQVQGWKFDGENRTWTYPLRMQTCHDLRETFGPEMQIGPRLTSWAKSAQKKFLAMKAVASAPDAELATLQKSHPAFWEAMSTRKYQRSGAAFLAATGIAACFDEPGLGKSAELIATIIEAGRWEGRHLVIVSNKTAIQSTWKREIEKWTPDAKVYAMPEGRAAREKMMAAFLADQTGSRFMVILPHMLQIKIDQWCNKCKKWADELDTAVHYSENHKTGPKDRKLDWPELFEIEWTAVIADECHDYLLKLRPGMVKNQPQWAHGMRRIGKNAKMRLPATGTPFRGREEKIFGILHWMDPQRFSSYWGFVEDFFEVEQTEHQLRGGRPGDKGYGKAVGRLRPEREDAFYTLLDSICLRRTRAEVRDDLPKEMVQEHWVPLQGEHQRQYLEFEEKGYAILESGMVEGMGRLSELTRMRQFAFGPWDIEPGDDPDGELKVNMFPIVKESPKVELMINMLEERGAWNEGPGMKFVIASQYKRIIDELEWYLDDILKVPYGVLKITGGVSAKRRSAAVDSFTGSMSGPKILLLNTKAGGASLTLDKYCDEMFILDETWVHDDQVQLIGRINNRGSEIRPRIFHMFRTEETIDERIAMGNADQGDMQSQILDRRRGKEVSLSLLRRTM